LLDNFKLPKRLSKSGWKTDTLQAGHCLLNGLSHQVAMKYYPLMVVLYYLPIIWRNR